MEQEKKPTIVKILQDDKQSRVTIPEEFVERFEVDPETDLFQWVEEEDSKGVSLYGRLMKDAKKKD